MMLEWKTQDRTHRLYANGKDTCRTVNKEGHWIAYHGKTVIGYARTRGDAQSLAEQNFGRAT